jgi:hypothetical protein
VVVYRFFDLSSFAVDLLWTVQTAATLGIVAGLVWLAVNFLRKPVAPRRTRH